MQRKRSKDAFGGLYQNKTLAVEIVNIKWWIFATGREDAHLKEICVPQANIALVVTMYEPIWRNFAPANGAVGDQQEEILSKQGQGFDMHNQMMLPHLRLDGM